jgi:hypothetical protein
MSRGTKLLITALFLVLPSILTIYAALTWHLRNPLRFRILSVKHQPQPTRDGYFMVAEIELEVINSSSTPVELCSTRFHREEGDTTRQVGRIYEESGTVLEGHIDRERMLSGNGRFHFKGWTRWPKGEPLDHDNLRVEYEFMSRTKSELWKTYWSLCKLIPETWRDSMPMPDLSMGEAPLEPAR